MPDNPPIDQAEFHVHAERPYKEGHPRFNLAVILLVLSLLLVFALVEAERLSL